MEDTRITIGYVEWVIVVVLTIDFFIFFSRNHKTLLSLLAFVMIPTWIIAAIMKGLESVYFENSTYLFSLRGFIMFLAESLPMVVLLGGITFMIKYVKFRKKQSQHIDPSI